ncbi:hypothetical protein ID866_3782 [Astraeus odoratus]|nr:hypothetical protein ID866_3782 [Astraeus odoratus]
MQRSIACLRITLSPKKRSPCRYPFHFPARRSSTVVLTDPLTADVQHDVHGGGLLPPSYVSFIDKALRERKFNALINSLSQETPDPPDVWACYVDFTSNLDYSDLPLEIHQKVLRKCVPETSVLRPLAARGMQRAAPPRVPHIYEARLKSVIRNIHLMGAKPALDDFHFILEQFAAVGHYTGSMQVYNELKHVHNLQPTVRTLGLCLQSIAHRLSLPMYKLQKARIVADAMSACRKLLEDLKELRIPLTSVVLDFTVRILKETADEQVFSQLMKMGYGIDLDYPDRLDSSVLGATTQPFLPFSTSALNTTLDMLGRFGNISKLVQAFEILTQPLPPQASQHYAKEFDDEDDFGVVNPASTQPYQSPHALPNTTTYCILLKHISRAGHSTFARHYLLQASRLDRTADRATRLQFRRHPDTTPPLQLAINRTMLLSVFGLANRTKEMELMRFVGVITRRAYRRKTKDTERYKQLEEQQQQRLHASSSFDDSQLSTTPSLSSPADALSSSSALSSQKPEYDIFSKPQTAPVKYFDLSTHLKVLRKDLDLISAFYLQEYLPAYTRTSQRVKERLGRRVWNEKDIYVRTENQRIKVSRHAWTEMVNYKGDRDTVKVAGRSSGLVSPLGFFDTSYSGN